MQPHTPGDPNELDPIVRRLAGWQPSAEGLDPDAMLFAAGRASGHHVRFLWLAVTLPLALFSIGSTWWGVSEHTKRVELSSLLQRAKPAIDQDSPDQIDASEGPVYTQSPEGYLNLRRQMEQDPGSWTAAFDSTSPTQGGAPPPQPSILSVGQRDSLLH